MRSATGPPRRSGLSKSPDLIYVLAIHVAQESVSRADADDDADLTRVVSEENECLGRVLDHLDRNRPRPSDRPPIDYESQMLALRDEIATARLEDVPPLVEQMERLQSLAAHRRETTEAYVDPKSPYFGRLVLEEKGKRREVLIGRGTYLDTQSGIR